MTFPEREHELVLLAIVLLNMAPAAPTPQSDEQ